MKKRKIIILVMVLFFAGIFYTADAHAAIKMQATTAVYMRRKASVKSKILDVVGEGKKVTFLSASGSWNLVRYRGKKGYVKAKYLRYTSYSSAQLASVRKKVIAYAKTRLGDKYSQKYRDCRGYADCSSLMRDAFKKATGVFIGDWTVEQHEKMQKYFYRINKLTDVSVGDQLFYFGKTSRKNHTGLYLGNGYVLHATAVYGKVVITHYSNINNYWQYGCRTAQYCLNKKLKSR